MHQLDSAQQHTAPPQTTGQAQQPSDSTASAHSLRDTLLNHLQHGARSLAESGKELLQQIARRQRATDSVTYLTQTPDKNSVINMNANHPAKSADHATAANHNHSAGSTRSANQLMRQHLPSLTRQLLGKRFHTINKIASLVMPEGSFDKAADQVLELLADFSSMLSHSDHVLSEAGVDSLQKLQADNQRSGRLARALAEKNRYLAIAQGAISGATGVVGAASDIPFSMILALRTIYLTGRAYGFELNQAEDRALVFEALSQADLSLITEKQAILLALRTIGTTLESGSVQGLQNLIGSSNDIEPLLKLLADDNGQLKWKISSTIISKLTPAAGGLIGAIYSARLLKEVSDSANQVFSQARQHSLGQGAITTGAETRPDADSSLTQPDRSGQDPAKPDQPADMVQPDQDRPVPPTIEDKIINPRQLDDQHDQAVQHEAQEAILHNDDIAKVQIVQRQAETQTTDEAKDAQIHNQLNALAEQLLTPAEAQATDTAKPSTPSDDVPQQAYDTSVKATAEKGSAEKGSAEKGSADKGISAKASADKASADKANADKDNKTDKTPTAKDHSSSKPNASKQKGS